MMDKLKNGIEFICVDDQQGFYTVSYKDNNLFTNRFDKNLPGKTNGKDNFRNISINEAINILDDKGLMVTDKKLALTVCSKWVLID
jgi:hypothetical protein